MIQKSPSQDSKGPAKDTPRREEGEILLQNLHQFLDSPQLAVVFAIFYYDLKLKLNHLHLEGDYLAVTTKRCEILRPKKGKRRLQNLGNYSTIVRQKKTKKKQKAPSTTPKPSRHKAD